MIELDMHTLWIWMVLAEGLFALLLGVVWSVRRAEPALAYWALASLSLSLGCLGISLRGQLPDWLSIGLANLLFSLSWSLRWAGLRRFAQQPLRLVWVLGPPLLIGLAFQLRNWLHLETSTRVALVALFSGVYAVLMIVDALRAQRQERLVMRSVIIGISVLGVLFEIGITLINLGGGPTQHFLAQNLANATVLLSLLVVSSLYGLSCFLMVFERHEGRLVRDATVDSLTNVLNRAGFGELASRQLQRNFRDSQPLSVLVMDLDHFKKVNDTHGHEAGDAVLRAFAQAARAALRPTDLLARAGGEEFWALLPQCALTEAERSAQRVCDGFRRVRVSHGDQHIAATVSIGVAAVNLATETIQAALARADQALYAAKHKGRDRFVTADAAPSGLHAVTA